jgi:hypothetical protein
MGQAVLTVFQSGEFRRELPLFFREAHGAERSLFRARRLGRFGSGRGRRLRSRGLGLRFR